MCFLQREKCSLATSSHRNWCILGWRSLVRHNKLAIQLVAWQVIISRFKNGHFYVKNNLSPFYLIVDDADWIERLVPLGVKLVQLRFKDQADAVARPEIQRAQKICRDHDCLLVVNDYWQAAIDLGCDYIHLGQSDLDTADVQAIKRSGIRFGVSTHDHAELERALSLDPDYVALGPIYPTISKELSWAPQGLEKLTEWKKLIGQRPLVAIGGITLECAPAVNGRRCRQCCGRDGHHAKRKPGDAGSRVVKSLERRIRINLTQSLLRAIVSPR